MTAAQPATPTCAVCGAAVAPDAARCPSCGLTRPAARGGDVFGRQGFWLLALMLVVIYAAVLLIVAAAR